MCGRWSRRGGRVRVNPAHPAGGASGDGGDGPAARAPDRPLLAVPAAHASPGRGWKVSTPLNRPPREAGGGDTEVASLVSWQLRASTPMSPTASWGAPDAGNVVRGSQPLRPPPGHLPVAGSALGGTSPLGNGCVRPGPREHGACCCPAGTAGVCGASVGSSQRNRCIGTHGKGAGAEAVTN